MLDIAFADQTGLQLVQSLPATETIAETKPNRSLRHAAGWRIDRAASRIREARARLALAVKRSRSAVAPRHALPFRVAISLTSYPRRFPTLHLTLISLLTQSLRPDRVILWIAVEDARLLPARVLGLRAMGLEIRYTADLRSFKKIVPSLLELGDHGIVTADDDLYYPRDWFAGLARHYRHGKEIVCWRAHRIVRDRAGARLPYGRWEMDVRAGDSDRELFPTSGAGVLYPPGVFHSDVTRDDLFLELCPTADDIWLYWMARRGGATFRKVGARFSLLSWTATHGHSLWQSNGHGGNDRQLARMARVFPLSHDGAGEWYEDFGQSGARDLPRVA